VILLSVAVSATTTFLTMRQSSKRGMMNQQVPDPDQPGAAMAQSMSKNMMYIAPFFALTGLYWQYDLVIYWVTTNVWTLGQQHILFRNLPIVGSATVGTSAAGAASGSNRPVVKSTVVKGSVNAAKSNGAAAAKSNGTAKSASKPGTASKPGAVGKSGASGTAATAKASPAAKSAANGTKPSATGPKPAANGARPAASRAVNNGTVSSSEAGSGGRGLLGFGKKKPEPEEVPVVPETKVVRQQPVRQARSKRSGSSGSSGKR
jgi:hypothetical protein